MSSKKTRQEQHGGTPPRSMIAMIACSILVLVAAWAAIRGRPSEGGGSSVNETLDELRSLLKAGTSAVAL
eukprot:2316606-Prymnesium_polylepis.1